MPIVHIHLVEGKTVEQKREMAQKVTDAIVDTLHCARTAVTIIYADMPPENYAPAGVLRLDTQK